MASMVSSADACSSSSTPSTASSSSLKKAGRRLTRNGYVPNLRLQSSCPSHVIDHLLELFMYSECMSLLLSLLAFVLVIFLLFLIPLKATASSIIKSDSALFVPLFFHASRCCVWPLRSPMRLVTAKRKFTRHAQTISTTIHVCCLVTA
jgi:hypothetical protein